MSWRESIKSRSQVLVTWLSHKRKVPIYLKKRQRSNLLSWGREFWTNIKSEKERKVWYDDKGWCINNLRLSLLVKSVSNVFCRLYIFCSRVVNYIFFCSVILLLYVILSSFVPFSYFVKCIDCYINSVSFVTCIISFVICITCKLIICDNESKKTWPNLDISCKFVSWVWRTWLIGK